MPTAPVSPPAAQPTVAARPAATARSKRQSTSRAAAPAAVLTREQEYAFIRNDLRRMVILAAVLIVGMIVTLFILESL